MPVHIVVDHLLDERIAIVARLDAVDLAVQLVVILRDVVEVLDAGLIRIIGHGERVLRARQVRRRQNLHLIRFPERVDHRVHRRRPVAEEHVDLLALHARERDRHGGDRLCRVIAQPLENRRCKSGRRGDIRPADIGEVHVSARGGLGGVRRIRTRQHRRNHRRDPQAFHVSLSQFFQGTTRPARATSQSPRGPKKNRPERRQADKRRSTLGACPNCARYALLK
jgi:hypothetical protein